jgi:hypothetical protein
MVARPHMSTSISPGVNMGSRSTGRTHASPCAPHHSTRTHAHNYTRIRGRANKQAHMDSRILHTNTHGRSPSTHASSHGHTVAATHLHKGLQLALTAPQRRGHERVQHGAGVVRVHRSGGPVPRRHERRQGLCKANKHEDNSEKKEPITCVTSRLRGEKHTCA